MIESQEEKNHRAAVARDTAAQEKLAELRIPNFGGAVLTEERQAAHTEAHEAEAARIETGKAWRAAQRRDASS
ncbi:hypothetical protein GCM10010425_82080 [Streptomyces spororaveus]|uniref:hypothetical protein n=1 Tax=Streptomyces spororaveus TaxID=284039 RepID=UPI0031D9F00D